MNKIVSCCGVICSDCEYYPKVCKGCPEIKGKPYWLQYAGSEVCPIYNCCINDRQFDHCGWCENLPCEKYRNDDPFKTKEENDEILRNQINQLKKL